MKDINLLPKITRKKSAADVLLNVFIVILVVGLAASAGLAFLLNNSNTSLSKKLDGLEKINLELRTYDEKLQAYKVFEDNVKYKGNMVNDIKSENIIWSEKFYNISNTIPQGVYLTNFSGDSGNLFDLISQVKKGLQYKDEKLPAFTIYGYASTYLEISEFVLGLKNIPDISDPWIVSINEDTVNNIKLLSFNIEAYWNLPLLLKDIKVENGSQDTEINNTGNQDLGNLLQ